MRDGERTTTCRVCGHDREAHTHYRRGTDCGLCGPEICPRFRPVLPWSRAVAEPVALRRVTCVPSPA